VLADRQYDEIDGDGHTSVGHEASCVGLMAEALCLSPLRSVIKPPSPAS
jgi:hypothetical protein